MSYSAVVVDSGGANIASLRCALERLGCDAQLSRDPAVIASADRIILPGVGAAADAMQRLNALQLTETLTSLTQPVLGICLGMQLLAAASAEDDAVCLAITDDRAALIRSSRELTVPHMGWNQITRCAQSPLLDGIDDGSYFYFVHSYALPLSETTIASCDYGAPFSAIIQHNNFYGTQFHPERSAQSGARLLKNFLRL